MTSSASSTETTQATSTGSFAPDQFSTRWRMWVNEVDAELESTLAKLSKRCPDRLREAMRYSLMAPGKRLRPILCVLACEAVGGARAVALKCAVALEMVHCYSLIHDDLPAMDDDDLRRGRPTCHIQFDEATAILAGDALQAFAFESIADSGLNAETALACCKELALAIGPEGMVGGQMDDLLAEKIEGDATLLHAIHSRKTGALIRASVLIGGLAGAATSEQIEGLKQFGVSIGIAFQIVDDLLDVESTAENTGKRTGKDQERGKLTYPSIYGVQASRSQAEHLIEQAIGAIANLGAEAEPLMQLARYITDRSH